MLAGIVAVAAVAAGCGSSSTGSGSSSAGSAGPSAGAGSFAAAVTSAMKGRPISWEGPATPAKAPAGVKMAAIVCDATLPGCALTGAVQAAKKLGWHVTSYNGQSNPDTQNQDIMSALASGDKVILLGGIDPRLVQHGLKAAKKAGVIVGSTNEGGFSPTPTLPLASGQVNVGFDVSADWTAMGASTADAIIADSHGSAHVLVITDPEFYSVDLVDQGGTAEFKKCSGCKVSVMKIAGAALTTTVPQNIVGFLNSHPDYKYIFAPYDGIPLSVVPALRQAGLSSVKMTGLQGNAPSLQLVKNGDIQFADVAFALNYTGWAAVDQAVRLLDHQPLSQPVGENTPWQLITKANVGSFTGTYDAPFQYESRYLSLWK
jgi:ribose transport system substrate-binding protein